MKKCESSRRSSKEVSGGETARTQAPAPQARIHSREVRNRNGYSQDLHAAGKRSHGRRGRLVTISGRSTRGRPCGRALTTLPLQCASTVSSRMVQETNDDGTLFSAPQCDIFGPPRGLAGRRRICEGTATDLLSGVPGSSDYETVSPDSPGTRSAPSLQEQESFQQEEGNTIDGVDHSLTLAPRKKVMASIGRWNI